MKYNILKQKIKQYDTIIIHRHARPDLDAIGSQLGLQEAIKTHFPKKKVYVVGDSSRFDHLGLMDEISDDVYDGSLVFIVDVAVTHLISDERYQLASEIFIIDHHTNDTDIERANTFIDSSYEAAAAYISDILERINMSPSSRGADLLLGGIITDSGRFQYLKNPERLFKIAARLVSQGAKPSLLYEWLYTEDIESRLMKNDFQSRMVISEGVAYIKNTQEIIDKYPEIDVFSISRGTVNLMAGIKGVPIWANFTYDVENEIILGEFRARGLVIVDIAKKYGGGGHDYACGAKLKSWDEVDLLIEDFKIRAKEGV